MAQTKKHIREAYNAKTYKQYNFRVRRDSDLFNFLEEWKAEGNPVNELVVERLTEHHKHLKKLGVWGDDD